MSTPPPAAGVITFVAFACILRERGRIASLAGQKRTAFDFYCRAERYERLGQRAAKGGWLSWPAAERPGAST